MNDSNFGGWIFCFLIIAVIFGWGGAGFGGGNAAAVGYATMADVNQAIANQSTAQSLAAIQLSSANNNYETARLIDSQTMAMTNQNNTNLLTAINGYNSVTQSLAAGFNSVNQNIADLGYKLDSCCCSIKTLMLERELAATSNDLQNQRNIAVNQAQSEFLLNTMGRWIANPSATTA